MQKLKNLNDGNRKWEVVIYGYFRIPSNIELPFKNEFKRTPNPSPLDTKVSHQKGNTIQKKI